MQFASFATARTREGSSMRTRNAPHSCISSSRRRPGSRSWSFQGWVPACAGTTVKDCGWRWIHHGSRAG